MRRFVRTLILLMLPAALLFAMPAGAAGLLDTYIYNYDGLPQKTPDAYLPKSIDMSLDIFQVQMKDPSDLFVAPGGDIYIADTGNSRILVFGPDYSQKAVISNFLNPYSGELETLMNPEGVFVTEDGAVYIADTGSERLVVLDREGNFIKILSRPAADMFSTSLTYTPIAVAVDKAGRIYVVSRNGTMGVIALNQNGQIESFLGAQTVTVNVLDLVWRALQTEEQKKASRKFIPTEYNNIDVDPDGFLYVTSSAVNAFEQYNAMVTRSRAGNYAPVKRLNPSGTDVLKRSGFFPPAGDVEVYHAGVPKFMPSRIVDVAVTENGQYSILDSQYNRVFTYSSEGELLYAFGRKGTQTGTFDIVSSIAYSGTDILVLDKGTGLVNIFYRTAYGDALANALQLQENRKYTAAREAWGALLNQNANLDMAHIGIGKTLYRQGDYFGAMQYFKNAGDKANYSKAFSEYRKEYIRGHYLPVLLVLLAAGAVIWLTGRFIRRQNLRREEKRRLLPDFAFSFKILARPIRGYGELVLENRGSLPAAWLILGLTLFSVLFQGNATGYLFTGEKTSPLWSAAQILMPFLLWCVCNWALTTLMNGEGTLRRIFIVSAYALLPVPLLRIPATILSNFMTAEEAGFYSVITGIAMAWAVLLFFFGTMVVHDYGWGKNVLACGLTLLFMVFLAFLGLLFFDLVQRLVSFVVSIYQEIHFRL